MEKDYPGTTLHQERLELEDWAESEIKKGRNYEAQIRFLTFTTYLNYIPGIPIPSATQNRLRRFDGCQTNTLSSLHLQGQNLRYVSDYMLNGRTITF